MTELPRPEYPRPQLRRPSWRNLNGPWRFAFDPQAIGEQQRWYRPGAAWPKPLTITVPFPWESPLSGVCAPAYKGAAWYEREITIPADWEGLVPYLNFGAVDWLARVWLDGTLIAEHANGYLPFSCDLSPHLQSGQSGTLTVRAYDIADAATLVGKQVPQWYTHSSGIWQTVWLEGRPPNHLSSLRLEPILDEEQLRVRLKLHIAQGGPFIIRLTSPDDSFPPLEEEDVLIAGQQEVDFHLPVPEPRLWSPETPHLYDLQIELEPENGGPADRVSSYFGMRRIERGRLQGRDYEYLCLNDEPVYLRGALDQAFHPQGLHTYPSDAVIRDDIQLAKDLGLNMLRCHIKINDPRYYYWADRLGLLIMYDLPCASIDTPAMRQVYRATLEEAIERDFNHPSIFAWVLFNETWGLEDLSRLDRQQWLQEMVNLARALDPTRPIEDNSPCNYDHVDSDINSWHYYLNDYDPVRRHIQRVVDETYPGSPFNYVGGAYVQGSAPLMNSEYAGISARMGDQDIAWSFKYQTSELRRHAKICGYVYTELTDIEWEHNGFVNYDRSHKFFGYDAFVAQMSIGDLNSPDFVGLDAPPCQTLPPGATFRAPLFVSHFGPPINKGRVRWQLDFVDRFGGHNTLQKGDLPLHPERFDVVTLDALQLALPDAPGLATIALWLEDDQGQVRCRNYINVEVRAAAAPRQERLANGWALRFKPGDFKRSSWDSPRVAPDGVKFAAGGSGWVEYELTLPDDLALDRLSGLELRFEAAARAGQAKIDWPQQLNGFNYPQTEEKTSPSDLTVSLNGLQLGSIRLPDDPADARGVLSHHHQFEPGSYGYLTDFRTDEALTATLRQRLADDRLLRLRFSIPADAEVVGGLALFGETLGGYPLDPTVLLTV